MPGEKDDLVLDDKQETPNEGLETEADAEHTDSEEVDDGTGAAAAEGDGSEAAEGEVTEPRRPSRGEARFQTLSNTAREAKEEAARARRESDELRQRLSRLEQPAQTPRGKSPEELALMTSDELVQYRLGEATKGFEQKLGAIQWNAIEMADKSSFAALVSRDPTAARYSDEVEQRLQQLRSQGSNVPRENLLTYIIGEKVRARNSGAKERAAADGKRKIERQRVPANGAGRGDTASARGKVTDKEALEKRLENITF